MASPNSDLPLTSRKFNVLIDVFVRHVYLWTLRNNERKSHASGTRRLAPQENALDPAENKFKVRAENFHKTSSRLPDEQKITIATTAVETGIAE
jgi:1,2-phenylacetyl-CoA epoxidase PaaB subunit